MVLALLTGELVRFLYGAGPAEVPVPPLVLGFPLVRVTVLPVLLGAWFLRWYPLRHRPSLFFVLVPPFGCAAVLALVLCVGVLCGADLVPLFCALLLGWRAICFFNQLRLQVLLRSSVTFCFPKFCRVCS